MVMTPPYVRLRLKDSFSGSSRCGASLIAPQYLLSAKHCFEQFWEWCIEPTDCLAYFRDLKTGRTNHEKGQFTIPIVEVFVKAGVSDLAVVMLKHKVEEHPDYKLGVPLQPIRLAAENPKPGDEVLTGGWGLTGQGLIKILIRVSQKTLFLRLSLALLTTHANRLCEPPK